MITHRPAVLRYVDRIVLIEQGQAAADGDPQSLAIDDSRFARYLKID